MILVDVNLLVAATMTSARDFARWSDLGLRSRDPLG